MCLCYLSMRSMPGCTGWCEFFSHFFSSSRVHLGKWNSETRLAMQRSLNSYACGVSKNISLFALECSTSSMHHSKLHVLDKVRATDECRLFHQYVSSRLYVRVYCIFVGPRTRVHVYSFFFSVRCHAYAIGIDHISQHHMLHACSSIRHSV